jgi:hypothetical protein
VRDLDDDTMWCIIKVKLSETTVGVSNWKGGGGLESSFLHVAVLSLTTLL